MQTGKSFLCRSLLCLALLAIFPGFSWAASSFKSDTSGFCCNNGILKESTEKQCQKVRGTFYPAKQKTTAQKECRSQKGKVAPKAAVSVKATVTGFCCANGIVKKTTQQQCSKIKGSYYKSSAEARRACKPKNVFCCVDGKISKISPSECKKRKGAPYKSAAEAKKKCKPADVFCCVDGKIKKSSPQQCKQHKGTAYKTVAEAKRKCKPAAIYCCFDGKITKSSPGKCKQRKGLTYKTVAEAKRNCKPAAIYCCINGTVQKISSKQCRNKKGKEYKTRFNAEKVCRQEKTSRKGSTPNGMRAVTAAKLGQVATKKVPSSKVGKIPTRNSGTVAVLNGYCCANDKVSRNNKKECQRQKGIFFKSRINAEKACRAKKAGVTTGTEKSRRNNPTSQSLNAKPATGSNGLFAETKRNSKGGQQPVIINRDGKFDASGAFVMPVGFAAAAGVDTKNKIPQITDRDISLQASQADWSIVSGRVIAIPQATFIPMRGQIVATLIGSPSPESSLNYITAPIQNGAYSMLLPPSSNWEVNVLPAVAFNYEELPPGQQVFTPATRREFPKSFTLTYAVEQTYEQTQNCRVSGSIMIDGEPAENFSIRVFEVATQGFSTVFRDFPAEGNRFTLFVPQGNYQIKPMFRSDSQDFNLIQPKDVTCDFNERHHIIVNFNINRAQQLDGAADAEVGLADGVVTSPIGDAGAGIDVDLAVINGRVTVNGQAGYRSILRVRFQTRGVLPTKTTEVRPGPSGEYHFAVVPDGTQYRVGVIVEENLGYGGAPIDLTIPSGASTQTHNFDIQFPEFHIVPEPIALRTVVSENGSKRYNFELKTVASPNLRNNVYSRQVNLRTNNSGVAHNRSCDFGNDTTCSFTLPAGQITEADTSLLVTISSELPGASDSTIEIPIVLDRQSDLIVDRLTLIEERPRQGLMAAGYSTLKDIQVKIKNIGGAPSAPLCPVGLSLNGTLLGNHWKAVEILDTDRHQSLLWQVEELVPGDVITIEIAEQCDRASGNNHYRHIVQEGEFRFRRN